MGAMSKLPGRFVRDLTIVFAAIVIALVLVGSIWERIERFQVARKFPARGRLVDIGGRKIQIDCRGTGSPTVVFESGLDIDGSLSWVKIQGPVTQFTRACSYSRAGLLWSDDKNGIHDGLGVAQDLHAALAAAGEKGPFVLVGHSLGGPYITIYTGLFGEQVVGLVYVDASHPDQQMRFEAALGKLPQPSPLIATAYKFTAKFSWTGIARLGADLLVGGSDMPVETEQISKAFASSSLGPMLTEKDALPTTLEEAGNFRALGARPIAVLTHVKPMPDAMRKSGGLTKADAEKMSRLWLDLQNDIASWSSRSTHIVVKGAGHYIQFDRPEVVTGAIREIVDKCRSDMSHASPSPHAG
jgi:pimeloyl-ACP methyl ester carboxylesterase